MPSRPTDSLHDVAVFARNYPDHLKDGLRRSRAKAGRLTTFASNLKWTTVGEAFRRHGPRHIFFAVVGEGPQLRYEAELVDLIFDPSLKDPATRRLLRHRVDPTLDDLWEGSVRTLYAVRGLRRIEDEPVMNSLTAFNTREPLSQEYKYGYALVFPLLSDRQAVDALPPAKRVESSVIRIVRDTKAVRRLKNLHGNRCQLCGKTVRLPNGNYSEGHHLQPLGAPHSGPDVPANILVVCPNHHAQLDFHAIVIRQADLRRHRDHRIGPAYIEYHNRLVEQVPS